MSGMPVPALFLGGPAHGRVIGVHPVDTRIRIPIPPEGVEYWTEPSTYLEPLATAVYYRSELNLFGRSIRVFVVEGQAHRMSDLAYAVLITDTGKAVAV